MKLHIFGFGLHASISWTGVIETEADEYIGESDVGVGVSLGDRLAVAALVQDDSI